MDVVPPLVAHLEPPILGEPGEGALGHPPMPAELLGGVDTSSCDPRLDVTTVQGLSAPTEVVGFIGMELVRSLPRSAPRALDRLDGIDHLFEHHRVVDVGRRDLGCERDSLPVDHNMALRARFAAIRRIRSGLFAPPGAGTLAESRDALDQSIWSASPRRFRSSWWRRCHTLASCQSRSRRQQVIPDPHPISLGSISQGMPVLSTNRMPARARLSGTLGRPPLGLGRSGGKSGLITFHSSSLSSGLAMAKPYQTPTRYC